MPINDRIRIAKHPIETIRFILKLVQMLDIDMCFIVYSFSEFGLVGKKSVEF
jgi:hypothetical protein